MRQDYCTFAGTLDGLQEMKKIGVIAVLGWRNSVFEAFEFIIEWIESVAPCLVRKRRIGNCKVDRQEAAIIQLEVRRSEGIIFPDLCSRFVVQDHVHLSQALGSVILFLSINSKATRRFI